ncbi:MAG: hypothetical protein RIC24_11400 [Hyphomicrobiales bacterium]|jgi:MFS-type transporter involved in bile tolerance (Atg22 family)
MVIVFAVSALVIAAFGALCGALAARFLSRKILYAIWAMLVAAAIFQFVQSRTLEDLDRVEANVIVFAVLLPFLLGSLLTGLSVKRRP